MPNTIYRCACGRRVYQSAGRTLNAAGAWKGYGHMCGFDGEEERGDHDQSPTRAEEIAAREARHA